MASATKARGQRHAGETPSEPATDGELAIVLVKAAREAGQAGLVHVASGEGRLERLARILWALAPDVDTLLFPPWDCLPFDRASPSARPMGLRVATLSRLAAGPAAGPVLVLATAEALVQRVPPPETWSDATLQLRKGDSFDLDALHADLVRTGYREDSRVDEAGEFAIRGQVVDIFPAGYYLPVRLEHREGRIVGLSSYDAATQRRTDEFDRLDIRPASEAVTPRDGTVERRPGIEHRLFELHGRLALLPDYLPSARILAAPGTEERIASFLDQVRDAHETRLRFGRAGDAAPRPTLLYAAEPDLAGHAVETLLSPDPAGSATAVPLFATEQRPNAAFAAFLRRQVAEKRRILVAAPGPRRLAALVAQAERALGREATAVEGWDAAVSAEAGALLQTIVDIDRGFVSAENGVAVVTPPDLFGSRSRTGGASHALFEDVEREFVLGDAAIHLLHGVGILDGLETIDAGAGGPQDMIRLTYAGGAKLMAPVDEIGLMWRYGAAGSAVKLDKIDGVSWPKRRAKVETEIGAAASGLAALARERSAETVPPLDPDHAAFERFVARFPFTPTHDQQEVVAAILDDFRSGHPTERLVCGDVGFGKTEVALRAAAAAVLAGRQVAVVAPTTVLVRQHLEVFRKRFAEIDIEVAHLSRLVGPADAKRVKAGLEDGSVRLVVGTHALAGKGVAFADLGLLILDEEQRFGAADKAKLKALGDGAHVLSLSATPIPRTLQAAMTGLLGIGVLATPPAERQPVRTVVEEPDEAVIRAALLREKRRGGQSFCVSPRIEDMPAIEATLRRLVPELEVLVAHGKLPVDEIDEAMIRFASGECDVLLATNIIESGLDVPRANTILVWNADRFGLGQLHQLRGRVGRGRVRGTAYLFTQAEAGIAPDTLKRLRTLERHDRLGAGFAISEEDLEQRGAGDLLGDTQAGHVKLIGAGLYRRLLTRALKEVRGEEDDPAWAPELHLGSSGLIPSAYVPEPEVRLNLYARLARIADPATDASFEEELQDRFGPMPPQVSALLATSRLRRRCRALGIGRIDAGPDGIALSFTGRREGDPALAGLATTDGSLSWRKGRLVLGRKTGTAERLDAIDAFLDRVEDGMAFSGDKATALP